MTTQLVEDIQVDGKPYRIVVECGVDSRGWTYLGEWINGFPYWFKHKMNYTDQEDRDLDMHSELRCIRAYLEDKKIERKTVYHGHSRDQLKIDFWVHRRD